MDFDVQVTSSGERSKEQTCTAAEISGTFDQENKISMKGAQRATREKCGKQTSCIPQVTPELTSQFETKTSNNYFISHSKV